MNWFKAAGLSLTLCVIASASPVSYTEMGDISGFFNLVPFTNKLGTVVLTGDTSAIMNFGGGIYENRGTATLTIAGVTSSPVTFTDSMAVIDEQGIPEAGISDISSSGMFVFATFDPFFSTYDLSKTIASLVGTGGIDTGPFPTTGGSLVITSLDPNTTFSAIVGVSSVPEPTFLIPLFVALTGIAIVRSRRARSELRSSQRT